MSTDNKSNGAERATLKWLLSEGIFLALVTVSGYFFAYLYEEGYASHYGMPSDLITITPGNVFRFSVLFILFLLVVLIFANWVTAQLPRHIHPYLSLHLPRYIALILVMGLMFYPALKSLGAVYVSILVGFPILWGLVVFVGPLIEHRRSGKLSSRYDEEIRIAEAKAGYLADFALRRFGRHWSLVVVLFVAAFFAVLIGGDLEAAQREDYFVTNTVPETVVIRVYGDNIICAEFDRKKKQVLPNFRIFKIGSDSGFEMSLEHIGPLTRITNQQ